MKSSSILVTCPKGCSAYLSRELQSLGYEAKSEVATGVFTTGTIEDCIRLNLQLRTGLRVLYEVSCFTARDSDELYDNSVSVPWEDWIPADGYVSIGSSVRNDTIVNTQYANLTLKDALVDRIREKRGRRPDTGNDNSKAMLFLFWHEDKVHLYLDTSGVPLSNRGYRVSPGKAPMRENLAASVIFATRWDRHSPFVNPMCGSGTLAIEAALLASGKPAGMLRDNFAFMHLLGYRHSEFEKMKRELGSEENGKPAVSIVATDIDRSVIEDAKRNAELAGVRNLIDFRVCDFRDTKVPEKPGVLIFNPEYGDRLGDESELIETYREIGDFLKKKAPGYWGYVFTGNIPLGKRVGLKPKRRVEFYNGPIECRLFEYELYSGSR
ncbi:hypothetical protein MLD52_08395 [Puniceicoccaceae bacterium K14]|nr:hypothetical protein [Puniceicoccaceae bacterium K14]